jgi:hypothetical protein
LNELMAEEIMIHWFPRNFSRICNSQYNPLLYILQDSFVLAHPYRFDLICSPLLFLIPQFSCAWTWTLEHDRRLKRCGVQTQV